MLQPRHPAFSLKLKLILSFGLLTILIIFVFVSFLINAKTPSPKTTVALFSPAQTLQPFQLNQGLFSQKNLAHHWTFLFFGFTHCSTICPATLAELKEAYHSLHTQYPELQVVFLSIDPDGEKTADVQHYLDSFNPKFIGLSGTQKQVENLKKQFGVHAERDPTLNHTSSLFLINPAGQWAALFPSGLRSEQIQDHFKTIVENYSYA